MGGRLCGSDQKEEARSGARGRSLSGFALRMLNAMSPLLMIVLFVVILLVVLLALALLGLAIVGAVEGA